MMRCAGSVVVTVFLATAACPAPAQTLQLEDILERMTEAGSALTTMQARVDRDTVNGLVDDHDLNAGTIYFATDGNASRIRLDITEPGTARQEVLVAGGQFESYNPRTNQVSRGTLGSGADIAQFLVVGFGPGNAALSSNFEIVLVGPEAFDGVPTSVLDLIPRSAEVLRNVSRIRLWVDHQRWVPIQQRLDQPSLNYQVVRYSDIKLNAGVPESRFELELPGDVQVLRIN